jgi:hypothetical protein
MNKQQRDRQQIKKCYKLFVENNIWSDDQDTFKKNFKSYALKNHPDKGGSNEVFALANQCHDILKHDFAYFKTIGKGISNSFEIPDFTSMPIPKSWGSAMPRPSSRTSSMPRPEPRTSSMPRPEPRPERPEPQSRPRPEPQSQSQPSKTTYAEFLSQRCGKSRGGWTKEDLQRICKELDIHYRKSEDKVDLCERISMFFNRGTNQSQDESVKKQAKLKEIHETRKKMMYQMNIILNEENALRLKKYQLQKQLDELSDIEKQFK